MLINNQNFNHFGIFGAFHFVPCFMHCFRYRPHMRFFLFRKTENFFKFSDFQFFRLNKETRDGKNIKVLLYFNNILIIKTYFIHPWQKPKNLKQFFSFSNAKMQVWMLPQSSFLMFLLICYLRSTIRQSPQFRQPLNAKHLPIFAEKLFKIKFVILFKLFWFSFEDVLSWYKSSLF